MTGHIVSTEAEALRSTDRCRDLRWASIAVIWAMAIWHSWESRGLVGDGSAYFVEIVLRQWPLHFYPARDYAMVASQLPLMSALLLGVTDLHWLARLLSFGLFALPTMFYHLALVQAQDDAVLLAAVILAIAAVFMTTSFDIAGEYNTAHAVAVLAGIILAKRPSVVGGLLLVAAATFALRIYETLGGLGLLFAARSAWLVHREPWPVARLTSSRPLRWALWTGLIVVVVATALIGRYVILVPVVALLFGAATLSLAGAAARTHLAGGLYVLATALFEASTSVTVQSFLSDVVWRRLEETVHEEFWWNIQFDLALATVSVAAVWAVAFPEQVKATRFYLGAGVGLVLLALSPLLALVDGEFGPGSQSNARIVATSVVLASILIMWAYRSESGYRPSVLVMLRDPLAGRRLAMWAFFMLVATLPADIVATRIHSAFLEAVRSTIRERSGLIAFEDTPLAAPPFVFMTSGHSLSSQSLALRSRPTDGIVLPPRDHTGWVAVDPGRPPDLGRYFWRE
jgi:hypothetical protein